MSIESYVMQGSVSLAALLTIVQVSPIKLNPWSAIARLIGKAFNGEVLERLESLERRLTILEGLDEQRDVVNSRIRILRFADECQEGRKHSKEHWDQTMRDITKYEHYCQVHHEFENGITVETAKYLKELYHNCLVEHTFKEEENDAE